MAYKKYGSIASLINSNNNETRYSSSKSIRAHTRHRLPLKPKLDYILRLAAEEDDFKRIIAAVQTASKSVVNQSESRRLHDIVKEAHQIYADNQKQLAMIFAKDGQFDIMEEHLGNAHVSVGGSLRLEMRITHEEVEKVIDVAVSHTPPPYFWKRAAKASDDGDIDGVKKYVSLFFKSSEAHGFVRIPKQWERVRSITPQFIQMKKKSGELLKNAYGVAIKNEILIAIGHAVAGRYNQGKIKEHMERAEDLLLESVGKFVREQDQEASYDMAMLMINNRLNPLMDGLIYSCQDGNDALHKHLRPKYKDERSYGVVIGVERTRPAPSALVPISFYRDFFEQTGLPIIIDAQYENVFRRYNPDFVSNEQTQELN